MLTSLFLCLIAPVQKEQPISDPAAKKIVDAMFEAYASCKTYVDTGTVVCGDSLITFKTAFSRPNKFYHEFTGKNYYDGRHVIWCRGSLVSKNPKDIPENRREGAYLETLTWDEGDTKVEVDRLGSAASAAAGISLGSSCTIATMLFPAEVSTVSCRDKPDLKFEKQQLVGKVNCDVLYSKDSHTRVWIARDTHLMMKWDDKLVDRCVITYAPKVNVKVPDSQFLFIPPFK